MMGEIDSRKALERLGLSGGEIEAYFSTVGKGVCLISEIAKHAKVDTNEAQNIVSKLMEKGLMKEIPGRTIRFQAIPPYSALLHQLEAFRDFITELRNTVPTQLKDEFENFEKGFSKVSGLDDFKKFVLQVEEEIPRKLTDTFTEIAGKFDKFSQLEEFEQFVASMRDSVPQELGSKFAQFSGQFDKLKEMDNFRGFVSGIRDKAKTELTSRFSTLETEFTELKQLDELKEKFKEIGETVPQQLKGSFADFQEQFKKVAGLESFKSYLANVKQTLPQRIGTEFALIEENFSKLKELEDFAEFVKGITTTVPQQMVGKFEAFEEKFRSVSGLMEFKDFIQDLRRNIPEELAGQFNEFEGAIKGIKTEILNTEVTLFSNYAKIMGDVFNEFIEAFVSDVVMEQIEKLKEIFQKRVIEGVQNILGKVLLKTQTMSQEVLDSFDELRKWLMKEIITGLETTLNSVNSKVDGAAKGVTAGFARLKDWITKEVTSDLENSLSEVEQGAIQASQQVVGAIDKLQGWFDEKVIVGLRQILGNMETKLGEVAQQAAESLKDVKSWFVKDAIEGIETTLEETQKAVETVQSEVKESLEKLEEWFKGEAINQLQESLAVVEGRVKSASAEVIKGFDEMKNWVSIDVIATIKNTMADVTSKVSTASEEINREISKLKVMFSNRVVDNTFSMLSGIEDRLWESESVMKAFWDKALSEINFRFSEVWFIQGADAMIGEISSIATRVKSKFFIVAPRLEDIDIVPLRNLSDRIAVRIAAFIDPDSDEAISIINEFIDKTNFRFRHYPDENIWGCSKDFEELIMAAVSGVEVAGIGSVIEEHIKNFNPVLEEAWMKGKPVNSIEDLQMLGIKRMPKKLRIPSASAEEPKVMSFKQTPTISEIPTELEKASAVISSGATDLRGVAKPTFMSDAFAKKKEEMAIEIKSKLDQLMVEVNNNPAKQVVGAKIEEIKEFTIQKYGFSRVVFDMSKVARRFTKNPREPVSEDEKSDLAEAIAAWKERL